jgi:hypothetical protein
MKRHAMLLLVAMPSAVFAAPPAPNTVAECVSEVLKEAPGAQNVRTRVLNHQSAQSVVEYTFIDSSGRRREVRFNLTPGPLNQSFMYDLSEARAYEGPVTGDVVEKWLTECGVGGVLVTK